MNGVNLQFGGNMRFVYNVVARWRYIKLTFLTATYNSSVNVLWCKCKLDHGFIKNNINLAKLHIDRICLCI